MRCHFSQFVHSLRTFPEPHHYVVFELDVEASLADLGVDLNDEEVRQALEQMKGMGKKYVGLVRERESVISTTKSPQSRVYLTRKIHLLAPAPPVADLQRGQEATMYFAVGTEVNDHPLDRPTLGPTAPLPWASGRAYHASLDSVDVRLPFAFAAGPGAWRFAPDAQFAYEEMFDADMRRAAAVRDAADAGRRLAMPEPLDLVNWEEPDEYAAVKPIGQEDVFYRAEFGGSPRTEEARMYQKRYGALPECSSGELCPRFCDQGEGDRPAWAAYQSDSGICISLPRNGGAGAELRAALEDYEAESAVDEPYDASLPVVRASYDLNGVEAINDPAGFFEELAALNGLREELFNRKQRNGVNTSTVTVQAPLVEEPVQTIPVDTGRQRTRTLSRGLQRVARKVRDWFYSV
ncbi:hypothetical protein MKEN_00177400 [Mycena kentingensis (nom. inval.)]|nr:hypothetical protein MKEN_00177400 [Mycena kentingensis (nom. inval.)]